MRMTAREDRTFPAYLFGGRLRTSTLVLLVAFIAVWWLYETYEPAAESPPQVPASEVVPPGFIPDPAYTWAPRSDFQRPTTTTTTTTSETTTPTTTPPPGEETPTPTTSGEPTSPATTAVSPPPSPPSPPPPLATTTPPPGPSQSGPPPSGPPPPASPPGTPTGRG